MRDQNRKQNLHFLIWGDDIRLFEAKNVPQSFHHHEVSESQQRSAIQRRNLWGRVSKSTSGEKSHSLSLSKETQEVFCIWEQLWGETTPTLGDPNGNQLLTTRSVSRPSSSPTQQRSHEGEKHCKDREHADGGQKCSKETQHKRNNTLKYVPLLTCRWSFEGQSTYPRLDWGTSLSLFFSPSYQSSKKTCKLLLPLQHVLSQRFESWSVCRAVTGIVREAPLRDK